MVGRNNWGSRGRCPRRPLAISPGGRCLAGTVIMLVKTCSRSFQVLIKPIDEIFL